MKRKEMKLKVDQVVKILISATKKRDKAQIYDKMVEAKLLLNDVLLEAKL